MHKPSSNSLLSVQEITTRELIPLQAQAGYHILDIRPIAAYNGWCLKGEPRGGHIPGARSIPLQWTSYLDWVEVLDEKNIASDDPVVVYGYNQRDSLNMARQLHKLGFEELYTYNKFTEEWAQDPQLPLDQLPRFRQLVYPDWVRQLINGQSPPHFDNDDYVICHAHYDHINDYERGHIPGAIPLDTNSLESTKTWNRRTPEELEKALAGHGIRHDTTVVLYGRFSSPKYEKEKFPGKSAGHLGALRCAAIMLYAGVEDVRILNGGITNWENLDYPIQTESQKPQAVKEFGKEIPAHPEYMIDTPKARQLLQSEKGLLVSIRSWEEFIGNRSGYHYIDQKGRIPGAIFGNCGSDAYHMENYRNFDHTMREYPEIRATWEEGGITPDQAIAFYCGTGWRGSEAFMNAYLMGWPDIAVYDGGWFEWCSDQENPIATGPPE